MAGDKEEVAQDDVIGVAPLRHDAIAGAAEELVERREWLCHDAPRGGGGDRVG